MEGIPQGPSGSVGDTGLPGQQGEPGVENKKVVPFPTSMLSTFDMNRLTDAFYKAAAELSDASAEKMVAALNKYRGDVARLDTITAEAIAIALETIPELGITGGRPMCMLIGHRIVAQMPSFIVVDPEPGGIINVKVPRGSDPVGDPNLASMMEHLGELVAPFRMAIFVTTEDTNIESISVKNMNRMGWFRLESMGSSPQPLKLSGSQPQTIDMQINKPQQLSSGLPGKPQGGQLGTQSISGQRTTGEQGAAGSSGPYGSGPTGGNYQGVDALGQKITLPGSVGASGSEGARGAGGPNLYDGQNPPGTKSIPEEFPLGNVRQDQ